jgi:hypothetical protein
MKSIFRLVAAAAVTMLSACNFFAPQQTQPLELLDSNPAATDIAAARATATAETDRILITLESAQTAVRSVDLQSTRIASTLIARGTPFIDTSQITPLPPTPFSFSASDAGASAVLDPNMQALVTPGGGAQGNTLNSPPLTPLQALATPTALPGVDAGGVDSSVLSRITLSRGVGADDCPVQADTVFTTQDTEIYVSAVANGLTASSAVNARFSANGTEVVSYDWTPTFDIDGACIWFFMPSGDAAFAAGNWSVTLSVNGVSAGSATFTIEDVMSDSSG